MSRNTVVRFVKRPQGFVDESSFAIEPAPMPQPADGQVVLRNFYHSLDPYMRPRMTEMDSYIAPFEVGQVMEGGGIGVVVESRHADYRPGDVVRGVLQWAEYQATTPTAFMRTLEPGRAAWKDYLGVLGSASLTAYVGLKLIGEPKAGETLYVSAASGAVGSIATQIGQIRGCRVVGSAGSDDKVAWLRDELRLDAAFNYRTATSVGAALAQHCPEGIDIDFENVGGATLQAVLDRAGRIKYRETIVEGIDQMPRALVGLFRGENFGKLLARVGDEPR